MIASPLFIVGFPRSGTTAMVRALCTDPDFFGDKREGHFFYLFKKALQRIEEGKVSRNAIWASPERRQALFRHLGRGLDEFHRRVYNRTSGRWIDKTPGHQQLQVLPYIDLLFPDARYMMISRSVFDSVRSNIANWPELEHDITDIARRWSIGRSAWRSFRSTIPADRFMEVKFNTFLNEPDMLVPDFTRVLELPKARGEKIVEYLKKNKTVNTPRGSARKTYVKFQLSDSDRETIVNAVGEEAEMGEAI